MNAFCNISLHDTTIYDHVDNTKGVLTEYQITREIQGHQIRPDVDDSKKDDHYT